MAREVLAHLTAAAFIDIRSTNHVGAHRVEIDNLPDRDRVAMLTNMFHNVPGQMNRAAQRQLRYQTALDLLWTENVGRYGAHPWLIAALEFGGFDSTHPVFGRWD